MVGSLRALLREVIDYAGLFPPAKLPLDTAIRNYARYRQSADAWMLGRFVCPAARLAELAPYHDELFAQSPPFAFAAIGRGGTTTAEFLVALETDLHDIAAFRQRHGDRVAVDILEMRLPGDVLIAGSTAASRLLADARKRIVELAGGPLRPFYEVPLTGNWHDILPRMARTIADERATIGDAAGPKPGFKLRTGGLEASAFPSPEQVAAVLSTCAELGLPLKFTAGLHDPLSHFDNDMQTPVHGFLNLLLAAVYVFAHEFKGEHDILGLIEAGSLDHLKFREDHLKWGVLDVTVATIEQARREFMLSFGSCSFDEPREELHALRWLWSD